jgi:hypothetical protein
MARAETANREISFSVGLRPLRHSTWVFLSDYTNSLYWIVSRHNRLGLDEEASRQHCTQKKENYQEVF